MAVRYVKLGETKLQGVFGGQKEYSIFLTGKETEKAIQIAIRAKITRASGRVQEEEKIEWLPKSRIKILDGYIAVEEWLAKEKGIPTCRIICTLDDEELRKETGLELLRLTEEDRITLLQQGYAKEEW